MLIVLFADDHLRAVVFECVLLFWELGKVDLDDFIDRGREGGIGGVGVFMPIEFEMRLKEVQRLQD